MEIKYFTPEGFLFFSFVVLFAAIFNTKDFFLALTFGLIESAVRGIQVKNKYKGFNKPASKNSRIYNLGDVPLSSVKEISKKLKSEKKEKKKEEIAKAMERVCMPPMESPARAKLGGASVRNLAASAEMESSSVGRW